MAAAHIISLPFHEPTYGVPPILIHRFVHCLNRFRSELLSIRSGEKSLPVNFFFFSPPLWLDFIHNRISLHIKTPIFLSKTISMREISLEHRDIRILRANFRVSLKRFNKVKPYGCTPAYQRPALFSPPFFLSFFLQRRPVAKNKPNGGYEVYGRKDRHGVI